MSRTTKAQPDLKLPNELQQELQAETGEQPVKEIGALEELEAKEVETKRIMKYSL
jgi:hypothetical protein